MKCFLFHYSDLFILFILFLVIRRSIVLDTFVIHKLSNEQVSMNIKQYKLFHGNRNYLLQKNFLCIFYSWNWCFTKWKNAQFSILLPKSFIVETSIKIYIWIVIKYWTKVIGTLLYKIYVITNTSLLVIWSNIEEGKKNVYT